MLGNIGEKLLGGLDIEDTYDILDDDIEIEDGLDGYEDYEEDEDTDEIEDYEEDGSSEWEYDEDEDTSEIDESDEDGSYEEDENTGEEDESECMDSEWEYGNETDIEDLDIWHRGANELPEQSRLAYSEWSNGYSALGGGDSEDSSIDNTNSGKSILDELSSGIIDVGNLDDMDNSNCLDDKYTIKSLECEVSRLEAEIAEYKGIKEERDRLLKVLSTKENEYKSLSADFDKLAEIAAEHKGKYNQLALAYKRLQARYSDVSTKFNSLSTRSEKLSDSSCTIKDAVIAKENMVNKKDTESGQGYSTNGHLSKQDYYSSLSTEKLYSVLADFLASKGVGEKPVEKEILVNEFGAGNVNKLIIKSYLVPLGTKVTMGKVMN